MEILSQQLEKSLKPGKRQGLWEIFRSQHMVPVRTDLQEAVVTVGETTGAEPFRGASLWRGNMRSRTDKGGHPGGRRTAEKEAVSVVKHCSLLSKTRPGDQWQYWTMWKTSGVPDGTLSVGCLSPGI